MTSEDGRYWNTHRRDGDKLLFYRDLGAGEVEKIELVPRGLGVEVVKYQNTAKFRYDKWSTAEMFFALPKEE